MHSLSARSFKIRHVNVLEGQESGIPRDGQLRVTQSSPSSKEETLGQTRLKLKQTISTWRIRNEEFLLLSSYHHPKKRVHQVNSTDLW